MIMNKAEKEEIRDLVKEEIKKLERRRKEKEKRRDPSSPGRRVREIK